MDGSRASLFHFVIQVPTEDGQAVREIDVFEPDASLDLDRLVTAHAEASALEEARALDGDGYLPEPTSMLPSPVEQRRVDAVVGRNDPCPCGSGKKYKRCHGAAI